MSQSGADVAPVSLFTRLPVAEKNSAIARILLAFLATAGFFYVNIIPALIDGFVDGLGLSNEDAGLIGSANIYGAAFGALAAVFLVKRIVWKKAAVVLLLGLISIDFASIYLSDPTVLKLVRFCHGFVGGMLVGIGFSVIARTSETDKTFGFLLTIQFGLGGVGLMYLPPLVPQYGTAALFITLMVFSVVTLFMLPFLDNYEVDNVEPAISSKPKQAINVKLLALALLATFLFQAANNAIYAYIIGIGKDAGHGTEHISHILGVSAWIAIVGSVLVILLSTRFGRLLPVVIATVLTIMGTWILHYSEQVMFYWLANIGVAITWSFVISYLLGMCSEFDSSGQMAALGGFASKMGLASGPMTAALIVGDNNYGLVINIAVWALVLCIAAVLVPAAALDRKKLTATIE